MRSRWPVHVPFRESSSAAAGSEFSPAATAANSAMNFVDMFPPGFRDYIVVGAANTIGRAHGGLWPAAAHVLAVGILSGGSPEKRGSRPRPGRLRPRRRPRA